MIQNEQKPVLKKAYISLYVSEWEVGKAEFNLIVESPEVLKSIVFTLKYIVMKTYNKTKMGLCCCGAEWCA